MTKYKSFLESKIKLALKSGFKISRKVLNPVLKPHQKDVVVWAIEGGQRAGFLSFGLGKTAIQLEIIHQVTKHKTGKALIVCPLGVKHEFQRDQKMLGYKPIKYITNTSQVEANQNTYITNYERIRKGDIDPSKFCVVTFDEASVLRSLNSQTVDILMNDFKKIKYRFVFTATPSPNRFLELTHYADFLGIMDRGQVLTRFFQRDSTTAGNLTLYKNREKEFWYWMSSWASFIVKPSDLGYDDTGYDLPLLEFKNHEVTYDRPASIDKKTKQVQAFANAAKSLVDLSRENRLSLESRIDKTLEIINDDDDSWVVWHFLEDERRLLEKRLKGKNFVSVYGSQAIDQKEEKLISFSEGKNKFLLTKPKIAGSGCNFQYHCHKAIFVNTTYKFNDFIQAVHRIYRFMQIDKVEIHVVHTDATTDVLDTLKQKWSNHIKLQSEMREIIKTHGLNSELYKKELKREFFRGRQEFENDRYKVVNNDNVEELKNFNSDSIGLICTSIPFGNHYEYSENYNCFGHNETNEKFFEQMDFLTPELFRVLMPGRIAAIHVKDRIRYSYQNGTGFTSIEPFSDHTMIHFLKHGFHCIGRITITTDVVQENNQTYRLGWSEKCKDGTKMGVGLPEYLLLFRKAPTEKSNAYADLPVTHAKEDYTRSQWQLDAHSYWKSSGERLADSTSLARLDLSQLLKLWKSYQSEENYDYQTHKTLCEELDKLGKLPTTFMAMPPISNNPDVWTDIVRMKTLNSEQSRKNLRKHICPLQLDLIERVIERYSNPEEIVLDPFGGIMSVPFQAVKMKRKGVGIELNTDYYLDGIKHLKTLDMKAKELTLFY